MNPSSFIVALLLLVGLIIGGGALFTDRRRAGDRASTWRPVAVRGLITEPGLHFKIPFIENVVFLDNRILRRKAQISKCSPQTISVWRWTASSDTGSLIRFVSTRRWAASGANNQLASVLNSAVRRVLSEANQQQIVRDERAALIVKIKDQANLEAHKFGVEVVDARISGARTFPSKSRKRSVGRMQTERPRGGGISRAGLRASAKDKGRARIAT